MLTSFPWKKSCKILWYHTSVYVLLDHYRVFETKQKLTKNRQGKVYRTAILGRFSVFPFSILDIFRISSFK